MKKIVNLRGILTASLIAAAILFFSFFTMECSQDRDSSGSLYKFIAEAEKNNFPTEYIKIISDKIRLKYRPRPAYGYGVVYLTYAFDENGNFKSFSEMDSFEISSVYHECFHAYIDLIIRKGLGSGKETQDFNNIMKEAINYYKETLQGEKIIWNIYRMQASEEAMAIHITNLIKYKIVYEKEAERAAGKYIYGMIEKEKLEQEIKSINEQWDKIAGGENTRGYYNKGFLRLKLEHLIDVKNFISNPEKDFVKNYILPGIYGKIEIPPLTEFAREARINGLKYDFLIEVNKNYLWDINYNTISFDEMDAEKINEIYDTAYNIYINENPTAE